MELFYCVFLLLVDFLHSVFHKKLSFLLNLIKILWVLHFFSPHILLKDFKPIFPRFLIQYNFILGLHKNNRIFFKPKTLKYLFWFCSISHLPVYLIFHLNLLLKNTRLQNLNLQAASKILYLYLDILSN
jgi:hypothetical protein